MKSHTETIKEMLKGVKEFREIVAKMTQSTHNYKLKEELIAEGYIPADCSYC